MDFSVLGLTSLVRRRRPRVNFPPIKRVEHIQYEIFPAKERQLIEPKALLDE
jgi:hypothetical protein